MMLASSCGLGQAAPTGLLDCLREFRSEFEKRVRAA
jgi:NADH:ubiquinone oxidoreductase subunit F (NADH-binding)